MYDALHANIPRKKCFSHELPKQQVIVVEIFSRYSLVRDKTEEGERGEGREVHSSVITQSTEPQPPARHTAGQRPVHPTVQHKYY